MEIAPRTAAIKPVLGVIPPSRRSLHNSMRCAPPCSAAVAEQGGAQRIELCSDLLEGGITPSTGLIAAVRRAISIELCTLIRPRVGDFCYSEAEMEIMRRDVCAAKQQGADGVALGILDVDGRIDAARMRELAELAAPMKVTCHRAFDMSYDLFQSVADLQNIGAQDR